MQTLRAFLIAIACLIAVPAHAGLSPYVLASEQAGDLKQVMIQTKDKLKTAGFSVVGMYKPSGKAWVLGITSGMLRGTAARSFRGGFGAVLRVSVTKVGDKVQVAYSNPDYWQNAFRLKGSLAPISATLKRTLGFKLFFPKTDLTASKLRKYHYMTMMPYFDDQDKLASHESYEKAIATVEAGLKARRGGSKRVYRVKIPGKKMTVYGVQLYKKCAAERHIMGIIDKGKIKSTPHLPYQLLVDGKDVYALRGRFRIAVAFPNLSMGQFMKIRCAPGEIQDNLELVAENKAE